MGMAQLLLIGTLFFAFCVNAAKGEDEWVNPLEFITMQTSNEDATKYGFQLLEGVRKVRMHCMERRDELERQFAMELEIWTKYSQQTQQVISEEGYEQYGMENKEILEKNLQLGYKEMYNGRSRRLDSIQFQCDNDLENLLQTHKVSLLRRTAELMANSPETLRHLINELLSYNSQLQDGMQQCIQAQTVKFESGVTSRLNRPEDYCYASDINIVSVFIQQMVHLIQEEQMNFFGDDEDLVNDGPCGTSGCEKPHVVTIERLPTVADSMVPATDDTDSEATEAAVHTVPPSRTSVTDHITKPSSASDEPPTLPSLSSTTDRKSSTTKPSLTTPQMQDPPTSEETQTSPTSPDPKLPTEPEFKPHTTIAPQITISDRPSSPTIPSPHTELPSPTSAPTRITTITTEESDAKAGTDPPTKVPDWVEDAFEEVFHASQRQQQADPKHVTADGGVGEEVENGAVEVKMDVEVGTPEETDGEDSRSHSHDDSSDGDTSKSGGSDGDHRSRTGGRHEGSKHSSPQEVVVDISPYFSDDAKNRAEQDDHSDDSSDSSNMYRILIYTFTAVGGVMVVAALVLVVAILAVQHKRRQLVASQLLTQEQKITIMKQTGYVNPTYKFFDQHKDS